MLDDVESREEDDPYIDVWSHERRESRLAWTSSGMPVSSCHLLHDVR